VGVDDGHLLQIGEVAERAGLSLRTVRYYEEVGLVVPSTRTGGGFRLYSDRDLQRLLLVKRMKGLRLSLEEMRELADLIEQNDASSPTDELAAWLERADEAIAKLERDLRQANELRQLLVGRLERPSSAPHRP
jgi:DNA-binding transcriptional MerR regulator